MLTCTINTSDEDIRITGQYLDACDWRVVHVGEYFTNMDRGFKSVAYFLALGVPVVFEFVGESSIDEFRGIGEPVGPSKGLFNHSIINH